MRIYGHGATRAYRGHPRARAALACLYTIHPRSSCVDPAAVSPTAHSTVKSLARLVPLSTAVHRPSCEQPSAATAHWGHSYYPSLCVCYIVLYSTIPRSAATAPWGHLNGTQAPVDARRAPKTPGGRHKPRRAARSPDRLPSRGCTERSRVRRRISSLRFSSPTVGSWRARPRSSSSRPTVPCSPRRSSNVGYVPRSVRRGWCNT